MLSKALFAAIAALVVLSPAYAQPSRATDDSLEPLLRRFQTDEAGLNRFYDTEFSPTLQKRMAAFRAEWRKTLDALDYDKLGTGARIDWLLLDGYLKHEDAQAALAAQREAEMLPLIPFAPKLVALEEARGRVEAPNGERFAATLDALSKELKAARAQKRNISPTLALRTARALDGLARTLATWYAHYDGFHPLVTWWCKTPYEALRRELADYSRALREETAKVKGRDDDPLIGDPIGRDALLADLAYERIPYTPEELMKLAEREFAWCETELKKATKEMGLGENTKAALERVKTLHAAPGEQDTLVAGQVRESIAFLQKNDLVTLEPLCIETWRLEMSSKQVQRNLPFAAYGGQKMLVAYPLAEMDHADKEMSLRANNEHFTRIVTPHELIPGHHLQSYMSERYRPYRQRFATPFLVEGWALYWEMQLWDKSWARSPEDRVGMLFWRMHRCARILVSLGFHLKTMTPEKMIDFLVERVGHERFSATSEVRRFIGGAYSPLYQCAYMIGGLQLRALAKEQGDSQRQTLKQLHDSLLHEGPIPIELLRAAVTGSRPVKNAPFWRF
ncbi:DUF885 family protein [Armatimonas rosea]|uniref:DUF885 domain-containing protein n=1 Tax=Armatimonas rosea TaxID=685828 RepID=A0A7W9W5M6_ARMRO|nr:DUF885 family protein [Armatimonas rosea]MBB6050629.1 hypothetical protein [Armatimonas rosea]